MIGSIRLGLKSNKNWMKLKLKTNINKSLKFCLISNQTSRIMKSHHNHLKCKKTKMTLLAKSIKNFKTPYPNISYDSLSNLYYTHVPIHTIQPLLLSFPITSKSKTNSITFIINKIN